MALPPSGRTLRSTADFATPIRNMVPAVRIEMPAEPVGPVENAIDDGGN